MVKASIHLWTWCPSTAIQACAASWGALRPACQKGTWYSSCIPQGREDPVNTG